MKRTQAVRRKNMPVLEDRHVKNLNRLASVEIVLFIGALSPIPEGLKVLVFIGFLGTAALLLYRLHRIRPI